MSEALDFHKNLKGKISVCSKSKLNKDNLRLAYTPGVAEVSLAIAEDKNKIYDYTSKGNMVAIVSDGSAVLGLGNIGPEGALPVMEGKAILFKEFGGVDAFPICLKTQDVEEIIDIVKNIEPVFGGINLEDISAPRCFEIEERLKKELDIPVFHDDQHGTAIIVLAALINSLKVVGKDKNVKILVNGAGAAGIAISKLLLGYGFKNLILCDSKGAVFEGRDGINKYKEEVVKSSALNVEGSLDIVIGGVDVFIGVSKGNVLTKEMVSKMNSDAVIFAMANPTPEIIPSEALAAGAKIVATGRSDFPNQVNNVLVFPGLFKGVLDSRVKCIDDGMKLAVAEVLAGCVENISEEKIVPGVFDEGVAEKVSEAVKKYVDSKF